MLDVPALLTALRAPDPRRALYRVLQFELLTRPKVDVGSDLAGILNLIHVNDPTAKEVELLQSACDWLLPGLFSP